MPLVIPPPAIRSKDTGYMINSPCNRARSSCSRSKLGLGTTRSPKIGGLRLDNVDLDTWAFSMLNGASDNLKGRFMISIGILKLYKKWRSQNDGKRGSS